LNNKQIQPILTNQPYLLTLLYLEAFVHHLPATVSDRYPTLLKL